MKFTSLGRFSILASIAIALLAETRGLAFRIPDRPVLPSFDKRVELALDAPVVSSEHQAALERLRARLAGVEVDFDPVTGAPKMISAREEFLSGRNGVGKAVSPAAATGLMAEDPNRACKAFLNDHKGLFGFGPEILDTAVVRREFVTARSGLRTVVWQQKVDEVPVFEAVLISHTTAIGELVNLSCQFVPDPNGAAERGASNRAMLVATPPISALKAVALAGRDLGESIEENAIIDAKDEVGVVSGGAERRQQFRVAGILGLAEASLVWLPMSKDRLQLCWEVILTTRTRGEMFRLLVDASSGELLLRHCLTQYISDVSYRVYTNDSPTPFSPGYATPVTNQPSVVARALVTTPALDTNASPAGWIDDGGNETRGNNVDAHTDRDNNNVADVPRPQGTPARVFDFPMPVGKDPTNFSPAAVVQLFYLCNWMHDRLYQLGFTEAAGNFQSNNFGRGGLGNDAVQADAQDGGGFNNANFSTPPDGSAGRMQMYLWSGPAPRRDGDFDAEVVLHEYTHGLSNRRVGGGVGISALQPQGMGEGWSDFYALSLLSQAGDDVNGNYAEGAYATYLAAANYLQNYYFGIRRYPYTTDMARNPLTYNDIDPGGADNCASGAPFNVGFLGGCNSAQPSEVHNQGEVWCVTLWGARANLINKYGWEVGNQLMLQLVTDGMNLSPANPTFLQARNAIIQADVVDNAGANLKELWAGFAKRGMGYSATGSINSTTVGVHEAFDVPDDLKVRPAGELVSSGNPGGPFSPACQSVVISNAGPSSIAWTASSSQLWASINPASGILEAGVSSNLDICLTGAANSLGLSNYAAILSFSNNTSGLTQSRNLNLAVLPPRLLYFPLDVDPGWSRQGQWAFGKPAGLGGTTHGRADPSGGATGSNVFGINLNGDYSTAVGGPYYLTLGPLDFGGYSNLKLQFQRWLNIDQRPFVSVSVEISTNGTSWSPIWTNGITEISDSAWTRVSYDISAYADNQPNVFIRWSHRLGLNGAFAYSGWNIDDVEILGFNSLDHFAWGHLPSPQVANVPFLVSVQAQNSTNGLVSSFSGQVNLGATNGLVSVAPGVSGSFVHGVWYGTVVVTQQVIDLVLHADDGAGHKGLANPITLVDAPTLEMSFDGTNLSIQWPAGSPGLILENSDSLTLPVWTPVSIPPVQIGDQFVVQVAVSDPQHFYRLRYTAP